MEKNPIEMKPETAFELMFGTNGKITVLLSQVMELTENIEKKIDISEKPLMTLISLGKLAFVMKEMENCFIGKQNSIIFHQNPKTNQAIQLFFVQLLKIENNECKVNVCKDQASINIFGDKEYQLTEGLDSIKMYKELVFNVPLGRYSGLREAAAEKLISGYVKEIMPRINTVRKLIYDYKTNLKSAYDAVVEAHKIEVPIREFASN